MFRTVLIDLDGTLLDHFAAIHRSHAYTREQLGLPAPTMDDVRRAIGGGVEAAVRRLLNSTDEALVQKALAIYRAYWAEHMLYGVSLLPGARDLLTQLNARGVRCAVFTNKHGPSAREVCTHLGVTPLLDGIFGASDTPWFKPERAFSDYALSQLRAQAVTTCLLGDSPYDIEAGRNGGFPCYCVTTGTHTAEELRAAGAKGVYENLVVLASEVFGLTVSAD